ELKAMRDMDAALKDPQLAALAEAHGADVKSQRSRDAKYALLMQVKEYDQWARDPRNADRAGELERRRFADKRRAQLLHQLEVLGGEAVYAKAIARYPRDGSPDAPLEQKVTLLQLLKDYTRLGGDAAYLQKVGSNHLEDETLLSKIEKLRAILVTQE